MTVAWIALNTVRGLGPVRIKQLLERLGTPEEVFRHAPSSLVAQGMISESCALQLENPDLMKNAEAQLEAAGRLGISVVTLADKRYPVYLREIFAPPPVLYVKGSFGAFDGHAVGVVGSRGPTVYGRQVTTSITRDLVAQHLVIISGLARGIDTAAHTACIEKCGKTIAVLGSGLDRIYPSENRSLAEKITESGALVSEFPLGTAPEAYNFPRRNRVISGLSAGVLVVEAAEKSGALITAHYALQQGREVFAIPGPISSPLSAGTFNLIKQGATPVRCAKDITESLSIIAQPQVMSCTSAPAPRLAMELLSENERGLLEHITEKPNRIDELAAKSGRLVPELFDLLLNLELKGIICQVSGQQFVRA